MLKQLYNKSIFVLSKYKHFFLILFFFLQYLLFRQYIHREILPIYPTAHDQVNYLNQAYEIYKSLQSFDISEIIRIFSSLHTGILLQVLTAVSYVFLGPSREIALTVNFFFYIFLQFYIYRFSKIIFKRSYPFLYFIGFLMMLSSIYYPIGGIIDFRLDFVAFCLNFMVILEILIFFKTSEKKSLSLIAILLTLLFYTRTNILIIYGIFFLLLTFYLFLTSRFTKYYSILVSFIIAFILVSPYISINIKNLYNYYYIGHISSNEKQYRREETKTQNKIDSILYYPKTLVYHQIGLKRALFIAINLFFLLAFIVKSKKQKKMDFFSVGVNLILGACFLIIYTLDEAKSSVVGMNLAIYLLVLLFLFYFDFFKYLKDKSPLIILISLFTFSLGSLILYKEYNRILPWSLDSRYLNVSKMMRFVNQKVDEYSLNNPTISSFYSNEISGRLTQYYHYYYENKSIKYKQILGNSLGPNLGNKSIEYARRSVQNSNIIYYNVGYWEPDWIPSNKNYQELRDNSNDLIEKYFCPAGDVFNLPWGKMRIYFKPQADIKVTTDNWIASETEINLLSDLDCLNKFNRIVIEGKNNRKEKKNITIFATYYLSGEKIADKIFTFTNTGSNYRFLIPIKIDSKTATSIKLTSNDFFVPCKISKSGDCRRLLINQPQSITIE